MLNVVNPQADKVHEVFGITDERNAELQKLLVGVLSICGPHAGYGTHVLLSEAHNFCITQEEVAVVMFSIGRFIEKFYES